MSRYRNTASVKGPGPVKSICIKSELKDTEERKTDNALLGDLTCFHCLGDHVQGVQHDRMMRFSHHEILSHLQAPGIATVLIALPESAQIPLVEPCQIKRDVSIPLDGDHEIYSWIQN